MAVAVNDLVSARVQAAPSAYFAPPPSPLVYDFNSGDPPPETLPLDDITAYLERAMDRIGARLGQYNPGGGDEIVRGHRGLRTRIADRIARRDGRPVEADWLMLCNGSSDGLALAARAYLGPGDGAITEAATYPFMVGYMNATGAQVARVPVDTEGMVVDAVEERIERFRADGVRPKMLYVIPTFHVPTGSLMPLARREQLLEIAQANDLIVVEDNAYHDHWFDEPPPPTIFSLDDTGLVLLSETFDKQLAPGLRLGYMTGVPEAVRALDVVREDLGVNQLVPTMIDEYIADDLLDPHLERFRACSRAKRDVALAALDRHCRPHVDFSVPKGGIYFWLRLADDVDPERLNQLMHAAGIATRAGEGFTGDATGIGYMRLAFQHETVENIQLGIAELGRALAESARPG